MCDAVSTFAALTTVVQGVTANQQAKKRNKFQALLENSQAENAAKAARSRYRGIIANRVEAREASARAAQDITRQALQASGIARLEGRGASVGAVLSDLATQEVTARAQLSRREAFGDLQSGLELEATRDQAAGRILASRRPRVFGPSFLQIALNAGGAAIEAGGFDKTKADFAQPASQGLQGPPLASGSFFSSSV